MSRTSIKMTFPPPYCSQIFLFVRILSLLRWFIGLCCTKECFFPRPYWETSRGRLLSTLNTKRIQVSYKILFYLLRLIIQLRYKWSHLMTTERNFLFPPNLCYWCDKSKCHSQIWLKCNNIWSSLAQRSVGPDIDHCLPLTIRSDWPR